MNTKKILIVALLAVVAVVLVWVVYVKVRIGVLSKTTTPPAQAAATQKPNPLLFGITNNTAQTIANAAAGLFGYNANNAPGIGANIDPYAGVNQVSSATDDGGDADNAVVDVTGENIDPNAGLNVVGDQYDDAND